MKLVVSVSASTYRREHRLIYVAAASDDVFSCGGSDAGRADACGAEGHRRVDLDVQELSRAQVRVALLEISECTGSIVQVPAMKRGIVVAVLMASPVFELLLARPNSVSADTYRQ